MPMPNGFEWEKIEVEPRRREKFVDRVWLERASAKSDKAYRRVCISKNLLEQTALIAGDRVDLFRHGQTYMFKPSEVGLYTLREKYKTKKGGTPPLFIMSTQLSSTIHALAQAERFDAWVDDGCILFKPRKDK